MARTLSLAEEEVSLIPKEFHFLIIFARKVGRDDP